MYCLRSLGSRDRGFESQTRHECLVCVCVFLCLCCPVFRQRHCDELITRPRGPTVCKNDHETEKQRPGPKRAVEPVKKNGEHVPAATNTRNNRRSVRGMSVDLCIPLSLLANNPVETFPRQRRIVGSVVFYVVRAASKESRR
jgi:hypothetical protein